MCKLHYFTSAYITHENFKGDFILTKIVKEVEINAPKAKVWDVLTDIGAVSNYNPVVTKSYYTSENKTGLGASRHCDLLPMGSVEEKKRVIR